MRGPQPLLFHCMHALDGWKRKRGKAEEKNKTTVAETECQRRRAARGRKQRRRQSTSQQTQRGAAKSTWRRRPATRKWSAARAGGAKSCGRSATFATRCRSCRRAATAGGPSACSRPATVRTAIRADRSAAPRAQRCSDASATSAKRPSATAADAFPSTRVRVRSTAPSAQSATAASGSTAAASSAAAPAVSFFAVRRRSFFFCLDLGNKQPRLFSLTHSFLPPSLRGLFVRAPGELPAGHCRVVQVLCVRSPWAVRVSAVQDLLLPRARARPRCAGHGARGRSWGCTTAWSRVQHEARHRNPLQALRFSCLRPLFAECEHQAARFRSRKARSRPWSSCSFSFSC